MIPQQQYFIAIDRSQLQVPQFHINSSLVPYQTSFTISQQQIHSKKYQHIPTLQPTFSSVPFVFIQTNSSQLQNQLSTNTISQQPCSPKFTQAQGTQERIINSQGNFQHEDQFKTFNQLSPVQQRKQINPISQNRCQNEQPLERCKSISLQQENNHEQLKRTQFFQPNNPCYQLNNNQPHQINAPINCVSQEFTRETRATSTLSSNFNIKSTKNEKFFAQTSESYFAMRKPSKLSNPQIFSTDQDLLEIARKYTREQKYIVHENTNHNRNDNQISNQQIKSSASNQIVSDQKKLDSSKLYLSNSQEETIKRNSNCFSPSKCSYLDAQKQLGEKLNQKGQQNLLQNGEQQNIKQIVKKQQQFSSFLEEVKEKDQSTDFKSTVNSIDNSESSFQSKEGEILQQREGPRQSNSNEFKSDQVDKNNINSIQKDKILLKNDHTPSTKAIHSNSNGILNCIQDKFDLDQQQNQNQNTQNTLNLPSKQSTNKQIMINKYEQSLTFEECSNTFPSKEDKQELPSDEIFSLVEMIHEKDCCNSKNLDIIEEELSELEISAVYNNNLEINKTNQLILKEDLTFKNKNLENYPTTSSQIHNINENNHKNKQNDLIRKIVTFIILALLLFFLFNLGNSRIWNNYSDFPSLALKSIEK